MYQYYFQKLDVFQRSFDLSDRIYNLTKKFPPEEKWGLTSQLRRASVSVMANLVEGNSRNTNKDQANFTTNSYSSLMELLSLLMLSERQGFIEKVAFIKLRKEIDVIAIELNGLKKKQLSKNQ